MIMRETLAGRTFCRWTVLDDHIKMARSERKWLCRCDCGTERYVLERSLKHGGSYCSYRDAKILPDSFVRNPAVFSRFSQF